MTVQQGPPTKDFLTDVDVLVRERDELRQKLEEMTQICHRLRNLANRDNARALEAERKRDTERARADVAEARLAKVDAAAAEMVERVKHLAWVASGAPMLGEESVCHEPSHLPPHTPRPGDVCHSGHPSNCPACNVPPVSR